MELRPEEISSIIKDQIKNYNSKLKKNSIEKKTISYQINVKVKKKNIA